MPTTHQHLMTTTRIRRQPSHHHLLLHPLLMLLLLLLLSSLTSSAFLCRPTPPLISSRLPRLSATGPPPAGKSNPTHNHNPLIDTSIEANPDGENDNDTFMDLFANRIPSWLLTRAENLGFTHPTLVQKEALGAILDGDDVVIQAQTGTGKTLAFMLPLLASIDASKKATQALVVVPSRELGLQVASVAKQLAAGRVYYQDEEDDDDDDDDADDKEETQTKEETNTDTSSSSFSSSSSSSSLPTTTTTPGHKILVMSLLEGSKNRRQKAWALAEPPHVVIGNPLALSRLVEKGGIRYHQVKMVVIDEVDACLTRRETRAQLQGLLGKYLSPSFLTAELEEEAAALGKEDAIAMSLPQGSMKEGTSTSTSSSHGSGKELAPWRLVHRQTIFASATIPQHNHFIKQCVQQQWTLNQPIHIQVTPGELMPPKLTHTYIVCPTKKEKLAVLCSFLKREKGKGRLDACVIFTSDDDEAQDIVVALEESGVLDEEEEEEEEEEGKSGAAKDTHTHTHTHTEEPRRKGGLQALLSQDHIKRRAKIMEAFRNGDSRALVTTDFAARGLDVPRISHVIMYDIPTDAETYLHRGGRAGRMGRKGWVTSVVSETEEFALQRVANLLRVEVKRAGVMKRGGGGGGKKRRSG